MHACTHARTHACIYACIHTEIPACIQVPAWTSLQLGPVYSVRAGDTLESIAARFGTTANNLLAANADIAVVNDQGMINMNDELCVLPYVCEFPKLTSAGGAYMSLD